MISRRSAAVACTGVRLLLSDPAPMLVTLIMPVLLAAFLVPGAQAQLRQAGYLHANGSEQVIPGVAVMFGYRATGSLAALALVATCFVAMLVAFGVMLVAVFPTMDLALVLGNLGGLVMTGLGGALAPVSSLPHWAQAAGHATPAYWALDALRRITLDGAGTTDVLPAVGAMLGFGALFAAVAGWRFQPAAVKVGTT